METKAIIHLKEQIYHLNRELQHFQYSIEFNVWNVMHDICEIQRSVQINIRNP